MFRHEDDSESDEDEEINEDDDSEVEIDVNPETRDINTLSRKYRILSISTLKLLPFHNKTFALHFTLK